MGFSLQCTDLTVSPNRWLNPFLFIRGLCCPSSVQTQLHVTQNCLKLTIPGFPYSCLPYLVVTLTLKNPRSFIGLEFRPQCAFTAFRVLLPSSNNAYRNGRWRTFFKFEAHQTAERCHARLDGR